MKNCFVSWLWCCSLSLLRCTRSGRRSCPCPCSQRPASFSRIFLSRFVFCVVYLLVRLSVGFWRQISSATDFLLEVRSPSDFRARAPTRPQLDFPLVVLAEAPVSRSCRWFCWSGQGVSRSDFDSPAWQFSSCSSILGAHTDSGRTGLWSSCRWIRFLQGSGAKLPLLSFPTRQCPVLVFVSFSSSWSLLAVFGPRFTIGPGLHHARALSPGKIYPARRLHCGSSVSLRDFVLRGRWPNRAKLGAVCVVLTARAPVKTPFLSC
jgi:hypothetical protein